MSTIAAISTPNAAGGIGIIRISGENAITIADGCFRAFSGKSVRSMKGYTAAYGEVFDDNGRIDESVLLVYHAPKSYTGEDVVELCCHGGLFIMQKTLRAVLALGAEPAEAGEFTKRAFLNGKMDLTQAESVMNVISAQGSTALTAAQNTLQGSVSKKIEAIAQALISSAAALAAWADYPDEDIPAVSAFELRNTLKTAQAELIALITRYDNGRAVTQGVNTVICGKPNVGKSTLMNLLAGHNRSIVTSVAGTTRDIVEETVRVGDVLLRLADTAGIHETDDEVESIGVGLARNRILSADLILAVFDVSRQLDDGDIELLKLCQNKKTLAIINKTDLDPMFSESDIKKYIPDTLYLSAANEANGDALKDALEKLLGLTGLDFTAEMLSNERQLASAKKALMFIEEGIAALDTGLTLDAVNVSIDCAVNELFTLTGKNVSEETVNEVFRSFCVGK